MCMALVATLFPWSSSRERRCGSESPWEVKLNLQAEIEPGARGSLNILGDMLLAGLSILLSLTCLSPSSSSPPGGGPGNPWHADFEPARVTGWIDQYVA